MKDTDDLSMAQFAKVFVAIIFLFALALIVIGLSASALSFLPRGDFMKSCAAVALAEKENVP